MKRFVAAFLLMGGLLAAGGANAAFLGNFTADCGASDTTGTVLGNVGDTFTVTNNSGYSCYFSSNPAGIVTPPYGFNTTQTFTLAGGSGTVSLGQGSGGPGTGYLTLTVTNPPATAVPSLSEWMQLLLALMAITLVGWHFHRERSY